jgi:hypothetical protein
MIKDNMPEFTTMMPPDPRHQMMGKVIVGDDKEREQRCMAEVKGVLGRYDCVLVPEVVIGGPQMQSRVRVQALPRVKG